VHAFPRDARLIKAAREVNDSKPHHVIKHVKELCAKHSYKRVALLGLAFKANIDDLRESPAVEIAKELAKIPSLVLRAVEPHVQELPKSLQEFSNLKLSDLDDALSNSELVVLLVDHSSFKSAKARIEKEAKALVDTRGFFRR
jgi:UDP-N-acetyl-D-mannosaminuronic acid dehydrogenase